MERRDETWHRWDEDISIASARYPTSARLVAAIHRGDEHAIRELFLLYAPLLRDQARTMGISPDERDHLVTTILDDVVLHLMDTQLAPRHLTRYLVAAFRNRARNHYRDIRRADGAREGGYAELGTSRQRVIAECHSSFGVSASEPTSAEALPSPRAPIAMLAEWCLRELTPDETTMLILVGRHVPPREIAAQLGTTYAAARVRLHRLRERFRRRVFEYVGSLKPAQRRELERFLRRAAERLPQTLAAKQQGEGQ